MEARGFNNQKNFQFEEFLGRFDELPLEDKVKAVLNQPDFSELLTNEGARFPYDVEGVQLFYLMRLGMAYAFEYSMLYEIILKNSKEDGSSMGVVSFVCGSCIDAWALAYARARLDMEGALPLEYWCYDLNPWEISIFDELRADKAILRFKSGRQYPIPKFKMHPPVAQSLGESFPINDQIKLDKDINVLYFPKVLNELKEEDVNTFVETLGELELDTGKTYYICVSHGYSDVTDENLLRGPRAVSKIIEDVFVPKGFTASADFTDVQSFTCNYDLGDTGAFFIDMGNGCFGITPEPKTHYRDINGHFNLIHVNLGHENQGTNLWNYVMNDVAGIINDDENIRRHFSDEKWREHVKKRERSGKSNLMLLWGVPMQYTDRFAFQIVKLTAKN